MSTRRSKESVALGKYATPREQLQESSPQIFDVFLCHNSDDKPKVREIAVQLQQRGIRPWLDEWELSPFVPFQIEIQKAISQFRAAAVFVGPSGIGPWEDLEVQALLQEFVRRKMRMGLVFLPGCPHEMDVPIFMRVFTWVDFRISDPDPLEQLIWGITGVRPAPPVHLM